MTNEQADIRLFIYGLAVICSLALALIGPRYAHAEQAGIDILAAQSPPMAMDDREQRGAVLELVVAAVERAGLRPRVKFVPWRRAQEMVASGQDLLIAPLTLLPSRIDRFTWIAPLCRMERSVASLKYRIDSLEQAMADRRSLVVGAGSAQDQQLRDMGYPAELIVTTPLGTREVEMLANGRVDGWYSGTLQIKVRWPREGDGRTLIMGRPVSVDQIFLGCSRNCDPTLVATLRGSLKSLRDDGTADRILARYNLFY